MNFSLKEIADLYGRPHSTTCRHVQSFKKKKKFKKDSPGVCYSEIEFKKLCKLLCIPDESVNKFIAKKK